MSTDLLIEVIRQKRKEIIEAFAPYGNCVISILGSADAADSKKAPDVEILLNLDGTSDDDILVYVSQTSRILESVRPIERHDMCMDLVFKLSALLGCTVDIVDERGLKCSYPITYSKLHQED